MIDNYEDFAEIVTKLKEYVDFQQKYVDEMADEFYPMLDIPYTDTECNKSTYLMKKLFGDLYADVEWFLYEIREDPENKPNIWVNCDTPEETAYAVHDLESYLDYARKEIFKNYKN